MKARRIERVFSYNGMRIPDPNPSMDHDAVLRALSLSYPELANGKVEHGETSNEGDKTIQTFNIRVAATTKG